jgi:N-methylhydantoinase A
VDRDSNAAPLDLSGGKAGPLIVEKYDTTCLVPPRARAELDAGGNVIIELE